MRKFIIAVVALCALLALPAAGYAQSDSGNDEYTENVPGGGGDKPSSDVNRDGGGLPPGSAQAFQALGADGQAAAALAQATAPRRAARGRNGDTGSAGGGAESEPAAGNDAGGGGIGDVVRDIAGGSDDGDGMGVALPLILGASLLGAVAFLLARRRGSTPAGPA